MTSDQESLLFYHALGEAISCWAFVELDLRHIVAACGEGDSRHFLAVGFFSIESFHAKLKYCDRIVAERFYKSERYSDWVRTRDRTEALSKTRNRLAHHTVFYFDNSKPGRRFALLNWAKEEFTAPSLGREYKIGHGAPPTGCMCLADIVVAKLEFEEHSKRLANVLAALLGRVEPWASLNEKKVNAPTHAELLENVKAKLLSQ
jgi:hypothetical protein